MKISQIVTSSDIKYAKQVHAFTEQGIANAQIIVSGYDDQVDIKGGKIVISNFFNWLKGEK